METYFIKIVDAPGLINLKGNEVPVEFSHRARNQLEVFCKCDGFLLYEKYRKSGGGLGAKCIFACGNIKNPESPITPPSPCNVDGKDFPISVMVIIKETLPDGKHQCGLSIGEINIICPELNFRPRPKLGGLYAINKAQFDDLCAELHNRIKINYN